MRKSRSVPTLSNRQPLCPQGRPSGLWPLQNGFSEYKAPLQRWEHANVKLSSLQSYEERSVWAKDSFHMHRPLNQRLERKKPEKTWRVTDVGNKYGFNQRNDFIKETAASNWDMWRPANYCAPPWKNSVYPRCFYSSSSCNSASVTQ
eukprot:TRINITY_DN21421_c0_g1_i1.p1 TRINITY_DN21421_c0_g1~~TRINITY_DN21421_c0_g1_i1.p1  ORF type:complete len:147 (+),score=22.18 TRINITY_DN21421_c0_g1_i1:101-541(+)